MAREKEQRRDDCQPPAQVVPPLRVVLAEVSRERERDQQRDEESTVVQANLDEDAAGLDLCSRIPSFP